MDRLLVLVMVAACGRIGFDAPSIGDGGSDSNRDAATSAYAAAVIADGPVGYWRFGDLARIVDEMGGPDGTTVGGCSTTAGNLVGDVDTSIGFDRTCYVDLGDGFPIVGRLPFSVEAWLDSDGLDFEHIITYQQRDQANPIDGYALLDSPSGLYFERVVATSNRTTTATTLPVSEVVHAVGTFDGMRSRTYLDGVQVGQSILDTAIAPSFPARLEAGAARRGNGDHQGYFEGTIDEVAVYDYALTPAQVLRHYQIGSTGTNP